MLAITTTSIFSQVKGEDMVMTAFPYPQTEEAKKVSQNRGVAVCVIMAATHLLSQKKGGRIWP